MQKRKSNDNFFEPIDLGLNIKFDPIIDPDPIKHSSAKNEFGFEPLIKPDNANNTSLSNDISSMAKGFQQDYTDIKKAVALMRDDYNKAKPKIKKIISKIKKTKLILPFSFKNLKSYKPDDAYHTH